MFIHKMLTLPTDLNVIAHSLVLKISIIELAGSLAEDFDEELILLMLKSRPCMYCLDVEDISRRRYTFSNN